MPSFFITLNIFTFCVYVVYVCYKFSIFVCMFACMCVCMCLCGLCDRSLYFCVVVLFVWVCVLGVLYLCVLVLFVWVCVASCYMCIFMHLVYLLVWVCGRVWNFVSVFLYIRCFCVRMFVVFVCVCVYVWCFCLCMCLCFVFLCMCVPFFVGRGLLCGRKVNHRYKRSHSVVQST